MHDQLLNLEESKTEYWRSAIDDTIEVGVRDANCQQFGTLQSNHCQVRNSESFGKICSLFSAFKKDNLHATTASKSTVEQGSQTSHEYEGT